MTELTVDGVGVAQVELAESLSDRRKGLLGRDGLDHAFWLRPCRHVHTFGMRFAIDVALVDRRGLVLHVSTMPRGRLGAVRWRCHSVIEAPEGALAGWGVRPGVVVAAS